MKRTWKAAEVVGIQYDKPRFMHVVKHLYNDCERWEQVIPDLVDPSFSAREAGCPQRALRVGANGYDWCGEQCQKHVLCDHDELYEPAYHKELVEADGADRVGFSDGGWFFVGERGVMVIVRCVKHASRPRRPEVKTAYRVVPRAGEEKTSENFYKAAVRKLRDKTSWMGGGL